MRILVSYISRIKTYTGANHFTHSFFSYFQNHTSHTLLGITFDTAPKDDSFCFRFGTSEGRETAWIGFRLTTDQFYSLADGRGDQESEDLVDRLAGVFREMKPDIFILNGLSLTAYVLFLAARKAEIPIVSIFHGLWFQEGDVYPHVSRERIAIRAKAEMRIVQESARCIFHTPLTLRVLEERVGFLPHEHVRFIPLPYHEAYHYLPQRKSSQHHSRKSIGLVGRWDPIKNHHFYLSLAKEVRRRGLNWDFFSVTTPVKENLALADIYQEYLDEIVVLPHHDIAALQEFYQRIDILIVPSLFETFSGVTIEAILQGTPVFTSARVGASDVLRACDLGHYVIDMVDVDLVIKKISETLDGSVPLSAREYIYRHLDPRVIFSRYHQVFLELSQ